MRISVVRRVIGSGKRDRERPCHFVLSQRRLYVLVDQKPGVAPPADEPYRHLAVAYSGALDSLRAIEIGLDRQVLLVQFAAKVRICASHAHVRACQAKF